MGAGAASPVQAVVWTALVTAVCSIALSRHVLLHSSLLGGRGVARPHSAAVPFHPTPLPHAAGLAPAATSQWAANSSSSVLRHGPAAAGDEQQELLALMAVPTTPGDFQKRLLHRATWVRYAARLPFVRVAFVMGPPPANDSQTRALVEEEAAAYGDVVFVPAKEGKDLLNKTGEMLLWAARTAPRHAFFVKVDTDTFVHPFNLAAYLSRLPTRRGVYMGMECVKARCYELHGVTFMMGGMYILSADLVHALGDWLSGPRLLPDNSGTRRFKTNKWIEDFYVGLLLDTVQHGAPHRHYAVSNLTFSHPYGTWSDARWWYPSVMGLHKLKYARMFVEAFRHYRPALDDAAACYARAAGRPHAAQVALCAPPQLPRIQALEDTAQR